MKRNPSGSILIAVAVILLMLSAQLLSLKIVLILAQKQALARYQAIKSYDAALSGLTVIVDVQAPWLSGDPSKEWIYDHLQQGLSLPLSTDSSTVLFKSPTAVYAVGLSEPTSRCLLKGTLAPSGNPSLYIKVEKL